MFNCIFEDCPKNSEKCHLWWEFPTEDEQGNSIGIKKGCALSQQIGFELIKVAVRAAHGAHEQSSKAMNEAAKTNDNLLNGMAQVGTIILDRLEKGLPDGRHSSDTAALHSKEE
jgi:hypothetical protein